MKPPSRSFLQFRNDAFAGEGVIPIGRISLSGLLLKSGGLLREKMRILGSYAIVYVIEGGGAYEDANGIARPVTAGDCLLLFPELAHRYGPQEGEIWSEIYVVFDGALFDLWRDAGFLAATRPVLRLEPVEAWQAKIESFASAARPITAIEQTLEICRLLQLLTEILAAQANEGAATHAGWLTRACDLLESDLESDISLEDVARRVGLSYETFRKLFQKQTGISPARFRAGRVIDAACAMMQHEGMTNKEIAARLGFSDEYHFSRRFKQITGDTPREFRRRLPQVAPYRQTENE